MHNHVVNYKFYKIIIFFICLFFVNLNELKNSYANQTTISKNFISNEVYDFVKFDLLLGYTPENNEDQYLLGLEVKLEPNWKIYWKNPGDAGLPPKITWEKTENVSTVNLLFPAPKRFSFYDIETFGYESEVVFPLEIKPIDKKKRIQGVLELDAQVCSQICVPVKHKFDLSKINYLFQDKKSLTKIIKYKDKIPQKSTNDKLKFVSGKIDGNLIKLKFENYLKDKVNDVILEGGKGFIYQKTNFIGDNGYLNIDFLKNNLAESMDSLKLTFLTNNISYELSIDNLDKKLNQISKPNFNLGIKIIIIAFAGGFILNFMPCVLPVLSLKMIQLVGFRAESRMVYRKKIVLNILGIMTTFLLLSFLTFLVKATGNYVGWGIQFQSPYFLIFMILLTFMFALNLFGVFHYFLPSKFLTFLSYKQEGYIGDFITGMFLTLLATPCTAPLVGTAIGFALSGGFVDIFSILLFMGLGLSLPLIILLFFPNIINFIPKPGNWLIVFKKLMALSLLVTSLWLTGILLSLLNIKNPISKVDKNFSETNWNIEQNFVFPSQLAQEGNTVFVDITADWCITCKVNKKFVLDNPEVIELFKKNNIIFLQLDWTKPNDKIKEFLAHKGRYGLPYNEIYSPSLINGKILPELLTTEIIREYINLSK